MKSRKADAMKDAGIDPVISDLIFARKKARFDPGFFVGRNQITDNWVYPCVLHNVGLAALHNVGLADLR